MRSGAPWPFSVECPRIIWGEYLIGVATASGHSVDTMLGYGSRLWPLALLLFLGACASAPERDSSRQSNNLAQSVGPQGVVEYRVTSKAMAMLWQQAEDARAEGDLDAAIRAIERAVEVKSDDPVLRSRLAELHLHAGEAALAEKLATQSNALIAENRLLSYRNWLIIEASRREQGDSEGSAAARTEIERLRGRQ